MRVKDRSAPTDSDLKKATEDLLAAARSAAMFMDIAIPMNGSWEDAFGPDLRQLNAAIRSAESARSGPKTKTE